MRFKDNGLANLHDRNREESGFCCMKLITFLMAEGVKEWDEWHEEHLNAARGECKYRTRCPVYRCSKNKTESDK